MKFTYLLVDLCTIILPLLFSFHPRIGFYKLFRPFFFANLITASFFLAWDVLFTKLGVWGFNGHYIVGIRFFGIPLEEFLFFICIPFACIFTYHCATLFLRIHWRPSVENRFTLVLSFLFLVVGISNLGRAYTAAVFLSAGILILFLKCVAGANWLSSFFIVGAALIVPFCIVNGILTGWGLQAPVVWYDDTQNLGRRLHTIPIEDFVYGMELVMVNLFLFKKFENNAHKTAGLFVNPVLK